MPIIDYRPVSEFDALRQRSIYGPDRADPITVQQQADPGFFETAFNSFATNSIVGTLGQRIGDSIFGPGGDRDEDFNPYDFFTEDFLNEHPFMFEDFESGRVLDIPNRESFFYYTARKQEDYERRQRAGQGGFVANIAGAVGPDAGLFAVTGGGAVRGVAPFKSVSSNVAQWLSTGNAATRIAKGAALGTVADVSNEGVLEFINPDRNVGPEAFREAAVWGAAIGAFIPLGGKLYGAAAERLVDTRWGRDLQKRVQMSIAKSDAIAQMPDIVARQADELDALLAETPTGTKVITILSGETADGTGAGSKVSEQARANGVKVEALKQKYAAAGHTLDVQPHPYQDYLNLTIDLDDLDATYRAVKPEGVVGRFAAALNSILPGGKARAMPSSVARFLTHTLFDDASLLAGNVADPLNFKNNPSAESLKPQIQMLHVMADEQIGGAFNRHFAAKGAAPITATLSDGTRVTAGRRMGFRKFRLMVTDLIRQENEMKRGARQSLSFEPTPAVREAADAVRHYSAQMLDRLDQAKLLQGPRALKAAQDELAKVEKSRQAIDSEISALGQPPKAAPVRAKTATTRSPGYKKAYKQRLDELEQVAPGDKANKATARELAKQDIQQKIDAEAAAANKAIDDYAAKKAEIEGRARDTDAKKTAAQTKVKEIEEFIASSEDYLTRRWLRHKIEGNKERFTGLLKDQWQRNRTTEFKTGKPRGERPVIEEALDRLDADTRKIIREAEDESAIPAELANAYENAVTAYFNDSAEKVYRLLTDLENTHGVQAIIKTPDALKGRVLEIDETKFRDFLDQDIQSILGHYDQQLSGRVAIRLAIDYNAATWVPLVKEITGETFDGSLDQLVNAVNRHFDDMLNKATDDAARAKIKKAKEQMGMIVDRKVSELEGRPPLKDNGSAAEAGWRAAGRIALRMPYLSLLGNMVVTNLMDLAGLVFMTGLNIRKIKLLASVFRREKGGFLPGVSRRELEGIASALDQTGIRNMHLNEVIDDPISSAPANTIGGKALQGADRLTGFLANKFGVFSGMNWLNTTTRRMAGHLVMDEIVNGAKKMSKAGKLIDGGMDQAKAFHRVGLAAEDAQRLSRLGFNAQEADRLIDILTEHAVDFEGARPWATRDEFMAHKGHISPEYERWYNVDRDLFDRFTAGINSEVNNIIVSPKSLSRPFINARWIGRALNQFWSFANAWSNQLAVIVGQRPGREQAIYFSSIIGLAAISDGIHNHLSGRRSFEETANLWTDPKTSMAMVYKAIDRSGVLGWLSRPMGMMDREGYGPSQFFGGDNVSSRYLGNVKGRLGYMGPVFDYGDRLAAGVIDTATKQDLRSLHMLRQTMPFQNLFYLNAIYRTTKDAGLDNPFGDGQGLDLFPLPTKPAFDFNRPEPLPEP